VTKTRSEELSERFTEQWHRCRDWLLPFMQNNQPKFLTKDELRAAAKRETQRVAKRVRRSVGHSHRRYGSPRLERTAAQ
jgi:hypothetical protein